MRTTVAKAATAMVLLATLAACSTDGSAGQTTRPTPAIPRPTATPNTSEDQGGAVGGMADFIGGNLKGAREQIASAARITATDISGQHRVVREESEWKICTQRPAPGYPVNDQSITFGVVKTEESC
ncbi:hypothetical protein [Streptomyces sp. NBC_00996]|uniref:hypothetical protein n=1 Tax=Streptomyces sp. NBC_00996 TaxID=2903710 RepID=UPI00386E977C|nr:hypothetical protein OG390_40630 [Streptomyces sp. NBC_00996]